MTALEDLFPPLGLTVSRGPLEMRGITDELLVGLCDLAAGGIHDPATMPFYFPWTDAPAEELRRNTAAYHWRARADFSVAAWDLNLAVLWDGRLVGTQGLSTSDFLVVRTGETGSWLGREFHGRGIGTAMRRAVCELAFDHLDFTEITSGAFLDNPASRAVSAKVGYRSNGVRRLPRRGELALNERLVLAPEDLVRDPDPLRVEGLGPLRRAVGLDA
ncbi:MAG: GNAT family N-acetyltransferase [Nocardioides sp.]|uniref:GNAT family N-acetyltransferase n=1 Tax=Nocardioides sp. TaxID=35761 RepID=UPI003EFF473B